MLVKEDYNCIGQVAKHCDNEKLCIAEIHALDFDVSELYCSLWGDILEIWNELINYAIELAECESDPDCTTPPIKPEDYDLKYSLIFGGNYTNCKGKSIKQYGVKRALIYYSYARYVKLNQVSDTASGLVKKNNDFSTNLDYKELKDTSDEYRNMGYLTFKRTLDFLCANKNIFDWFDAKECGYCGCGSDKCGGTKAKGFGIRSSNISRN